MQNIKIECENEDVKPPPAPPQQLSLPKLSPSSPSPLMSSSTLSPSPSSLTYSHSIGSSSSYHDKTTISTPTSSSTCSSSSSSSATSSPLSTQNHCRPPSKKRKVDIDELLDSVMSIDQAAQFELWKRMINMQTFDWQRLMWLRTAIDDRIRLDIISAVPYEIALYIMSFLDPQDLCQAAQTCRSWRTVCEDNRLWRDKCRDEGLLSDEQTLDVLFKKRIAKSHKIQEEFATEMNSTVPKSEWKLAYLKHINILRNWRTRGFEIKEPFICAPQQSQEQEQVQERPSRRTQNHHQQPSRATLSIKNDDQQSINQVSNLASQPIKCEHDANEHDDSEDDTHLMRLSCHADQVITCLQYNPKTHTIVSGSDDQTLKVWSSETGKCLTTLEGHTGGVWSSQLSPDDIVISGATDRTVRIWRAHTGELLHTLYGHTSTVRCLALDGDKVVSGSRDTTLRLWDIINGECLYIFVGHSAAVRCVEYKDGTIVSGAYDHLVMVWDASTGSCRHVLERHCQRIYSLQFDGKTIASGSLDSTICIWDADTGKLRHRLKGHESLTSKMQLRGNLLVSANADSYCKLWDVNTGQCLQTLGGENKHTSAITSVYFNNRHVVTSSDDGSVKLWDVKTGEFIRNLIVLPTASSGGVVWRIKASYTKLICAVGSRAETEDTHLLVLDFNE